MSEYTDLLEDARRHAIDRMVANAKLLGANAIVSMRFDSSEMGNQLTEVVAYGTAVVIERDASGRERLAALLGRHYADGRFEADELSRRLDLVFAGERRRTRSRASRRSTPRRAEAPLGPPPRRVRRRRPDAGCRPRSASSTRAPSG